MDIDRSSYFCCFLEYVREERDSHALERNLSKVIFFFFAWSSVNTERKNERRNAFGTNSSEIYMGFGNVPSG